jgi:hypothetical protein
VGAVEELTDLVSLHPLRIRRSEHLLKEKHPGLKALVLYRDNCAHGSLDTTQGTVTNLQFRPPYPQWVQGDEVSQLLHRSHLLSKMGISVHLPLEAVLKHGSRM